ncbi:hypothetical protein CTAYLR_001432 [Chrysophaeum taylorii]|uniref:Multicopper oxidase family protein n=1 Tax=Chrysophaeum taylorii TaxID=2483200 RepID=A0AAD7XGE0_9STRA|nr:hypothetical protein CTAYLR_001432 [Chrysophaeum taylorii]
MGDGEEVVARWSRGRAQRRAICIGVGVAVFLIGYVAIPSSARAGGVVMGVDEFSPKERRMVREKDRVVSTTLRVVVGVDARGVVARSYDGLFPGPTLRARPGDTLVVRLANELGGSLPSTSVPNALQWPNATSLHVHGLHVSPLEDDVFSVVGPGESKTYRYAIADDHPLGTFWYHAHYHGSSSIQDAGGMAGALVIDGGLSRRPGEVVIVLQQTNLAVGKARNYAFASNVSGSLLPVVDSPDRLARAPLNRSFFTVNGRVKPTLKVEGRQLWRIINAASNDFVAIEIPDACDAWTVARDGISIPPRRDELILLVPGSRADLSVACDANGNVVSRLEDRSFVGAKTAVFEGVLFKVAAASGHQHRGLEGGIVVAPPPASLLEEASARFFSFEWSQRPTRVARGGVPYEWYGINGREYDHSVVAREVRLGEVEEWLVVSNQNTNHPFHVHAFHFQIAKIEPASFSYGGGAAPDYRVGDWRDTIAIPAPGNVTVRFRPDIPGGLVLAHCHIFVHADLGMQLLFRANNTTPS